MLGLLHSNPRATVERMPVVATLVGLGLVGILCAICARAAIHDRSDRMRIPALTILVYSAALIGARTTGRFDDLSVGRFFLPVLLPAGTLIAQLALPSWLARSAAGAVAAVALLTVARTPSAQTSGRVDEARSLLQTRASPGSTVLLSDNAIALAASLDADLIWARDPRAVLPPADYLVLAAHSADRHGSQYAFDPRWLEREAALTAQGWSLLLATEHVRVLRSPGVR